MIECSSLILYKKQYDLRCQIFIIRFLDAVFRRSSMAFIKFYFFSWQLELKEDASKLFPKYKHKIFTMSLKICITVVLLPSFLVFRNDANRLNGNNYYACPKSPKLISAVINLSPFQVSSDSRDNSARDIPLVVIPISRRTFKKLDMTLLPSREVCVLGNKLKNFVLPEKSQFAI